MDLGKWFAFRHDNKKDKTYQILKNIGYLKNNKNLIPFFMVF